MSENTLQQLVEEKLQAAQANKKFKDAGSRVSGSRKERNAWKRVTIENLADLEKSELSELVEKDRVFPNFDWKVQREQGVTAGAAWLKNKIRKSIKKKPIDFAEARLVYVVTLTWIRESIEPLKTIKEIKDFLDQLHYRFGYKSYRLKEPLQSGNRMVRSIPIKDILGATIINLTRTGLETRKNAFLNATLRDEFTQESRDALILDAKRRVQEQYDNYLSFLYDFQDAEFYDDIREMGYEIRQYETYRNRKTFLSPVENDFERDKNNNIKRIEKILVYLDVDKVEETFTEAEYKVRKADWSWAKIEGDEVTVVEKQPKKQPKKTEMPLDYREPIKEIIRIGGRKVKDVSVANIREKFCYHYVEFGNALKDREAEYHVKHFIGAMLDMEEALGIDLCKLNKMGQLSIAFASRGKRGSAATYNSQKKIINLTNKSGDGSVAHEWLHFLDNFLGKEVYIKEYELVNGGAGTFASKNGASSSLVEQKVRAIMNYINKGKTQKKIVRYKSKDRNLYGYGDNLLEIHGKLSNLRGWSDYKHANNGSVKNGWGAAAKKLKLEHIDLEYDALMTDFYDNSSKMKSVYWVKEVELFARAWECYVQDKLATKGMTNNYLVSMYPFYTVLGLYPDGEERKHLFKLFDDFVDTIREVYELHIKPIADDVERVNYTEANNLTKIKPPKEFAKPDVPTISTIDLEKQYLENATPKQQLWMTAMQDKFLKKYKVRPTFSMIENMQEKAKADMEQWTAEWVEEHGDWRENANLQSTVNNQNETWEKNNESDKKNSQLINVWEIDPCNLSDLLNNHLVEVRKEGFFRTVRIEGVKNFEFSYRNDVTNDGYNVIGAFFKALKVAIDGKNVGNSLLSSYTDLQPYNYFGKLDYFVKNTFNHFLNDTVSLVVADEGLLSLFKSEVSECFFYIKGYNGKYLFMIMNKFLSKINDKGLLSGLELLDGFYENRKELSFNGIKKYYIRKVQVALDKGKKVTDEVKNQFDELKDYVPKSKRMLEKYRKESAARWLSTVKAVQDVSEFSFYTYWEVIRVIKKYYNPVRFSRREIAKAFIKEYGTEIESVTVGVSAESMAGAMANPIQISVKITKGGYEVINGKKVVFDDDAKQYKVGAYFETVPSVEELIDTLLTRPYRALFSPKKLRPLVYPTADEIMETGYWDYNSVRVEPMDKKDIVSLVEKPFNQRFLGLHSYYPFKVLKKNELNVQRLEKSEVISTLLKEGKLNDDSIDFKSMSKSDFLKLDYLPKPLPNIDREVFYQIITDTPKESNDVMYSYVLNEFYKKYNAIPIWTQIGKMDSSVRDFVVGLMKEHWNGIEDNKYYGEVRPAEDDKDLYFDRNDITLLNIEDVLNRREGIFIDKGKRYFSMEFILDSFFDKESISETINRVIEGESYNNFDFAKAYWWSLGRLFVVLERVKQFEEEINERAFRSKNELGRYSGSDPLIESVRNEYLILRVDTKGLPLEVYNKRNKEVALLLAIESWLKSKGLVNGDEVFKQTRLFAKQMMENDGLSIEGFNDNYKRSPLWKFFDSKNEPITSPYQQTYNKTKDKHLALKSIGLDDLLPTVQQYGKRFLAVKSMDNTNADFQIFLDVETMCKAIENDKIKHYGIMASHRGFEYFEIDGQDACRSELLYSMRLGEAEAADVVPLMSLSEQLDLVNGYLEREVLTSDKSEDEEWDWDALYQQWGVDDDDDDDDVKKTSVRNGIIDERNEIIDLSSLLNNKAFVSELKKAKKYIAHAMNNPIKKTDGTVRVGHDEYSFQQKSIYQINLKRRKLKLLSANAFVSVEAMINNKTLTFGKFEDLSLGDTQDKLTPEDESIYGVLKRYAPKEFFRPYWNRIFKS